MNDAPLDDKPAVRKKRLTPRRGLALLIVGLLIAAVAGLGIKLRRYRAAYDAVISSGGKIEFHGPGWARRISAEKPLPYIDTVTAVTLQDRELPAGTCTEILSHLQQFPGLKSLNFSGNAVPDSAAGHFEKLGTQFTKLDLSRTDIGDKTAEKLQQFRELRVLDLSNTKITDTGLTAVANLLSLRQLNLDHTPVTDDGIQQFRTLTRLNELNVADTDVTDEGVAKLKAALPDTEIYDD